MRFRLLLVLCALIGRPPGGAAELLPVETFAATPRFSRARLSPDGKSIAFMAEKDGREWLTILDLETKKSARIDPGTPPVGPTREVRMFRWITDKRLSYYTTFWDGAYFTGVTAVDRDGKKWKAYSGPDADPMNPNPLVAIDIIHTFQDEDASVLMLDRGVNFGDDRFYHDVIKVGTYSGRIESAMQNPGNVLHWAVDRAGVVRVGITDEKEGIGAIYRESAAAPWRKLPPFDKSRGHLQLLGFTPDGKQLLVVAENETRRRAVYYYDPAAGELGEMVLSHPSYDIVPANGIPHRDDVPLAGLIRAGAAHELVGVRFLMEGPGVKWLDPKYQDFQQAIDRALPGTVNVITSVASDEQRLLVLAFSDREPGRYYLLDVRGGQPVFSLVGTQFDGFPTEKMAPMFPIKYPARDGETVHGYLTLPVGGKQKGLPLVVLPHGGPFVRDVWGYSYLVQFLANRGYAVLQMNYRGSPGYGVEFLEKGKREIGRGMQTDIDDGTRWAIAQGIADPARVAILGGSFGGYSVLYALGKSPGLYRCGVSIAGVTDWAAMARDRKSDEYRFAYAHFKEWIGDPKHNAQFLAEISPRNFATEIKAPLLLVQGKDDRIVPLKQAQVMVEALEKAGKKPRVVYLADEGHSFTKEKSRLRLLREIEDFLALNLAPISGG